MGEFTTEEVKDLISLNSIKTELEAILGYPGKILTWSKSVYREQHPNDVIVFNSNIFIEGVKMWFGDLNVTKSREMLSNFAKEYDTEMYVLYELDGRFECEYKPRLENAAAVFHPDGTVSFKNV